MQLVSREPCAAGMTRREHFFIERQGDVSHESVYVYAAYVLTALAACGQYRSPSPSFLLALFRSCGGFTMPTPGFGGRIELATNISAFPATRIPARKGPSARASPERSHRRRATGRADPSAIAGKGKSVDESTRRLRIHSSPISRGSEHGPTVRAAPGRAQFGRVPDQHRPKRRHQGRRGGHPRKDDRQRHAVL